MSLRGSPLLHAVAFAAIGVAVLLAAVWALRLPIFLEPDEDSHYDYALTLAQAGRPLRPAENVLGRDTHPVVDYLMSATHARAVRLDGHVPADPGYGTRDYYARLEANAPRVEASAYRRGPIAPAPYIARLYPIGYYAFGAGVIGLAGLAWPDSALVPFFSLRLASAVMLAPALLLLWLSLCELRLKPVRALLVLVSVALLPMIAFTGGSVQPDSLAALLVAALTYAALRLRRQPNRLLLYVALGILFALLVAVKRHYFVAALLPISAMLGVRIHWRSEARFAVAAAAFALLPPVAAYALTAAWMRASNPVTGVCRYDPALGAPAPLDLPHYLAHGLWTALTGSFGFTQGLESFWLEYGAYRSTTLSLGNGTLDALALRFLPVASCIFVAMVVWRLLIVWKRLLSIARKRSPRSAARVATGNVLLNGYLVLVVLVIGYITWIGGSFGIQGRYWLPYTAGVFFCVYTVAPRALPRRYGNALAGIVAVLVLSLEVLAAFGTVPSLERRYYRAIGAPVISDETIVTATARRDRGLLVDGIGVDLRAAAPLQAVELRVTSQAGVTRTMSASAVARPDVECKLEKGLRQTGFTARVPESLLSPGSTVAVFVRTRWTRGFADSGRRVSVTP